MGITVVTNINFTEFSRVHRRVTKTTKGWENLSFEKNVRKLHLFSVMVSHWLNFVYLNVR